MSKKYPDYYPEGCPPPDAEVCKYEVYRLIKSSDEIKPEDFIPKAVNESLENLSDDWKICSYGLSVVQNPKDYIKLLEMASGMRSKMKGIAKGCTYEYTGVVKKTPTGRLPSHITWWIYKDYNPHKKFELFSDGSPNIIRFLEAI